MTLKTYPDTDGLGYGLVPPGKLVQIDLDVWILYTGDKDTVEGPHPDAWVEHIAGKHSAMVIGCDHSLCFYRILLDEKLYWISVQACSPLGS